MTASAGSIESHDPSNNNDSTAAEDTPLLPSHSAAPPVKHFSTRDSFFLLVSIQIGSGIFTSPSQVDVNTPSPAVALLIWLAGGLLAWTGATAFAELGAMLPSSGGMVEYLRFCYGDLTAGLMALSWILLVKPTASAILAILCVESLVSGFKHTGEGNLVWEKPAAIGVLWLFTLLNCTSTRFVKRMSEVFALFKFFTVAVIMLSGLSMIFYHVFWYDEGGKYGRTTDWYSRNWFKTRPGDTDWSSINTWSLLGHLSAALYGSLFAYSGWDNANFLAAEMKDPGRSLPISINAAMFTVITCFQVANISYYILLPWEVVSSSDAVAVVAMRFTFGKAASIIIGFLIAASCAGALNGNIITYGRMSVAAAGRGYVPAWFYAENGLVARLLQPCINVCGKPFRQAKNSGSFSERFAGNCLAQECHSNSPKPATKDSHRWIALTSGSLVATIFVIVGNFRTLVTFMGLVDMTFFFLPVLAVIILRYRDAAIKRPYKPSVLFSATFCVVCAIVVARSVVFEPFQALIFLVLLFLGAIWYKMRA